MTIVDGIAETISDFLAEKNIKIARDDLQQLAEDINYGCQVWNETAYGHIPNPLESEIRSEKDKTKKAVDDHDRDYEKWRKEREEWRREVTRLEWQLEDARRQGFRN